MYTILYEKIEDYFKMLETLPKKDIQIFVSNVKNISDNGLISTAILIQAFKDDICVMYRYTEDMPVFQLINDMLFNAIPDHARESAKKAYNEAYNEFLKKQQGEYNKLVDLLRNMGFVNIINAFIQ